MRHIKTAFAASIIFLLTACATPSDLRSQAPVTELSSTKSAQIVAGCIADKLEVLFKSMEVNSRPATNGYAISVSGNVSMGRDTAVVVDVTNAPPGSRTSLYSHMIMGQDKVVTILTACQA